MDIESTTNGKHWTIAVYKMRKPARVNATECEISTVAGLVTTTIEWNSRRLNVELKGNATVKNVQAAYAELMQTMHANSYISAQTLQNNPNFTG